MGRPSSFRKPGGGFLNDVDAKITDIRFSDCEYNGAPFEPGTNPKTGEDKFHALRASISILVDGATDPIEQHLFAGAFDSFEVSEDGRTLTPVEDGYVLGAGTGFANFILSLEKAGHPGVLSDDETVLDYSPIIGSRVRVTQVPQFDKSGKALTRKGKAGTRFADKVFPVTATEVSKFYGVEAPAKKSSPKAAKASSKVDLDELAAVTILEVLEANDAPLAKSKLRLKIFSKIKDASTRDAVIKLSQSDDFLASVEGVTFENDTLSLSA